MIKTQIQLPDKLYRELKRVAAQKEWSLAETMRRGAEYIVTVNPASPKRAAWRPPRPRKLGKFLAPASQWTAIAHE